MAKLYFRGILDIDEYRKREIKQNDCLAIFKYNRDDKERVQKELYRIVEANDRNIANGKEPIELEINVKIHYRARSIAENNLIWSIYTKFAEILNHEAKTVKQITAQELYDADMNEYAQRHEITVPEKLVTAIIDYAENGQGDDYRGHIIKREYFEKDMVKLTFIETSSFWTIEKAAEFIDIKLNELEEMRNRTQDGEIKGMIDDFNKLLKKGRK